VAYMSPRRELACIWANKTDRWLPAPTELVRRAAREVQNDATRAPDYYKNFGQQRRDGLALVEPSSAKLPVVATIERAFRTDDEVRDVLDIPDFVGVPTHVQQRIVVGRAGVGWIE